MHTTTRQTDKEKRWKGSRQRDRNETENSGGDRQRRERSKTKRERKTKIKRETRDNEIVRKEGEVKMVSGQRKSSNEGKLQIDRD